VNNHQYDHNSEGSKDAKRSEDGDSRQEEVDDRNVFWKTSEHPSDRIWIKEKNLSPCYFIQDPLMQNFWACKDYFENGQGSDEC